jgi:hypothetical protein
MSSDLIGGYLTFYLNQPIKWADFRLDALLADTMLSASIDILKRPFASFSGLLPANKDCRKSGE